MPIELYDWQQRDVEKLEEHRARLITSEMGTGKTYEGYELDKRNVVNDNGNTLVIAPLGAQDGWVKKFIQMQLDVPLVQIDPKQRDKSWKIFKDKKGAIFLCHPQVLRLMPELRGEVFWEHIILDECQAIQDRKAQQTIALKRLRCAYKTAMSGTPATTNTHRYWSVLNWLYPNQFRSFHKFVEEFVDYEIKYPEGYKVYKGIKPHMIPVLNELIEPWHVRHLKKQQCCPDHPNGVMPWLPDKYYDVQWVDLKPEQRRAYEEMRKEALAWVGRMGDQPLAAGMVNIQMMRLQQFCNAFAELTIENEVMLAEPSSKLDRLMEIIEANPGKQFVIWSQFKKMIWLAEARFRQKGISYVEYTGDNRSSRELDKDRFIAGEAQVFIGTTSAGGVGLDGLQGAASTVIFLDRQWSPALNAQAEDRLWRDGQTQAVQVIDIVARNTVELGRHQRIEQKWKWLMDLLNHRIDQKAEAEDERATAA